MQGQEREFNFEKKNAFGRCLFTLHEKSAKPVSINELQTQVWGHSSKLDTHTVETHIYRLRKKISNKFNNDDFIKSTKLGYNIK